jgi:hypothetical protein
MAGMVGCSGLVYRMTAENSGKGAPKIHRELLKLGFEVSERTVARYLQRLRRQGDPAKRWLAFLANHREVIVAFDFFTVLSQRSNVDSDRVGGQNTFSSGDLP